ncbi:MAG: hypothetical protein LH609_11910, partial [Rudanella sp.]|nr:hypothetical protein [Rudanella sp.]
FCATQDHALAVRDLINQLYVSNNSLSKDPNYCVRVTAADGERGEQSLRDFQDNEKNIPTILTTSQKLSTGVDARNVRNIVLMRPVNSMIEFKQIIGRGTRLYDGKDYFTIYDFVKAHHHFSDPEWDGEPIELVENLSSEKAEKALREPREMKQNEAEYETKKKIKVKRHVTCTTCAGNGSKNGTAVQTCTTCNGLGQTRKVVNTMLGQMISTSTCQTCNGEGKIVTDRCETCFGEGRILEEDVIPIKIPAGVAEGIQLSVGGKGNVPPRGGVAGDLLIVVEEEEDVDLKRDGHNVVFDLHITFPDAALGTSVEVPTIDGRARITLEPGTQSGKILRLKGKGIKELNGYGRGDQLIHVNVWTPRTLSAEEKTILEKLRNSPNFQPKPNKGDKGFFEKMKDFFHG